MHPHVVPPSHKDFHFLTFNYPDAPITEYFAFFNTSALVHPLGCAEAGVCYGITYDSAPSYFWHRSRQPWSAKFLLPEMLRRVLPESRLVLILRDPVERAWSDYSHFCGSQNPVTGFACQFSPEDFDRRVRESMGHIQSCFAERHILECVYDETIQMQVRPRESVSLMSRLPKRAHLPDSLSL